MRLLRTLRAVEPLLRTEGVLVIGSEVPNLLQPGAGSTLVVSQDVDIGVPVSRHGRVKAALGELSGLQQSEEEPSVWVPRSPDLIEVNFIGIDPALQDTTESYVLDDPDLPLLVFGALSYLELGAPVEVEGMMIPVPRPAGLILEKLMTDRSGVKGERDLLVVLALLLVSAPSDLDEVVRLASDLPEETKRHVLDNLTLLSLAEPVAGMPDPRPHRHKIAKMMARLERAGK